MPQIFDKLIGNKEQFSLEHRVFNVSLIAGIVMSLQATITNIILNFPTLTFIITSLGVIIFFSVYLYSKIKVKLITPAILTFSFLVLFFTPTVWITGAGTTGVFQYYIFIYAVVISGVLTGKLRIIFLSLLFVITVGLIIFETQYPQYIFAYPSEKERYIDFIIHIPIVLIVTSLLIYIYINQYVIANKKIKKQNIEYEKTLLDLKEVLNKLQQAQDKLIESEKMASLGNLVAGVAHEMNTPIGIGVQATSGILDRTVELAEHVKKGKTNNKQFIDYLTYVYNSSKLAFFHLSRTGELIKSFKLISVDQSTEELRVFNLNTYITDTLVSLKSEFKDKDIMVKIECEDYLVIKSYPGVLAQIITNLVINTIIHGFKKQNEGQILIRAEKQNDILKIIYKDNGCGVKKDVLQKIFEPFFTTDKQHGTGLGMHIIYNLVTQKLGGHITCESEIGEGITFIIVIPG